MDTDEQVVKIVEALRTDIATLLDKGVTKFSVDVHWERMDNWDETVPFCITPRISIKVGGER